MFTPRLFLRPYACRHVLGARRCCRRHFVCLVFRFQGDAASFIPPSHHRRIIPPQLPSRVFTAGIKCRRPSPDLRLTNRRNLKKTQNLTAGPGSLRLSPRQVSLLAHMCDDTRASARFGPPRARARARPACSDAPATDNRWSACIRSVLFPCGSQICQK